jgi:NAD(P)H-dependent FMN reductase
LSERSPIHIVALNGSPNRNRNTVTLMKWVVEGCVEAGAEVEWIHIADHDIQYCRGCHTCMRVGECPIQDDVPAIRDRLLAADGVVVGSPVYEGQPTAQLKTLMDRLALFILYTNLFAHLHSVGVVTSGVAPTRATARAGAEFGQCSGIIGARTASFIRGYQPLAEVHSPRLVRKARALGRRLMRDIQRPERAFDLKGLWISFLRQLLNKFLVYRYPDQFGGAVRIQQENRWAAQRQGS